MKVRLVCLIALLLAVLTLNVAVCAQQPQAAAHRQNSAEVIQIATGQSVLLAQAQTQGNPNTKVWVNTSSGVYHCPGTRWYGATKRGQYMAQAEAQKAGFRPAYGKTCQ